MIFWLRTNVSIGQSQFVSDQCALSDSTRGNTSHSLSFREVLLDSMAEFEFDKRTYIGISQCLTIVSIDR